MPARFCGAGRWSALHFFAVHLGTSMAERREQSRLLFSEGILEAPEFQGARIAGDFNDWTRTFAKDFLRHDLVSADLFLHTDRRTTFPAVLPFLHLDHIYYDRAFRLCKMYLDRSPPALLASDHSPLSADFEMPKPK